MKKWNRKTLLSIVSIFFILAVIIVSTCFNAGLDPSKWLSAEYLSTLLITLAIAVFGMISSTGLGDNYYRTNEVGLFKKTYDDYNSSRLKITPILDKFSAWNNNLYNIEYQSKITRFLKVDNGIKQAEQILKLDRTQVILLNEPCKFEIDGKEFYFKSLSQEQIDAVLLVFDGKIKLKFVHDSYYLNAYSRSKSKSMYEQASVQEKTRQKKFIGLIAYRLIISILIGLIFAGLIVDKINGDGGTKQMWLNLMSRLFTFFTSMSWGFFIASEMIKDECIFLAYKTRTLETFYLDVEVNKTFMPKTEEELAYEEYLKMKGVSDKK
jgi:hypothetical protein